MKKIIFKLIIIVAVLLISDRVFDHFFSRYIFAKTLSGESGGTVNYLLQKKSNLDFVVLGSSRAKHQIDPAALTGLYNGNGYNAGINGLGGMLYNNELLYIMLSNGIIPKTVVLQMDAAPYFTTNDENNMREVLPLYPYISKNTHLEQTIQQDAGFAERFLLFFHSYRYNGKLLNILFNYAKRNSLAENNGFVGLQGQIDTVRLLPKEHPVGKRTLSEYKIRALESIIQTCTNNKMELAVVFPPTYKNAELYKDGTDSLIRLLHKNNIRRIYDFSDIEKHPVLKPATLWKDLMHLNEKGALIFSTLLNGSIISTH